MKSLLTIPINQTGKTVITTNVAISETSDFTTPIYENNYAGDQTSIILEETFINRPLYMRVIKTFTDDTVEEYVDTNPVVRGKTEPIRELEFNSNINAGVTKSVANNETTVTITFDRPVDYIHTAVLRNDTSDVVTTVSVESNTITFVLANTDFFGTVADLLISSSLKGIPYRNIIHSVDIAFSINIIGLRDVYFMDTSTFIDIQATGNYKLFIDDEELPASSVHRYNIREYLSYGKPSKVKLVLNTGETIEKDIITSPKVKDNRRRRPIEDHIEETSYVIDKLRVTHPTNGDILNNTLFYLIEEDARIKLYSYYIPADISNKLDPDFSHGDNIDELIIIDDSMLGLVVTGTTTKLCVYNYFLAPLYLGTPLVIDLPNYAACKLTYLPIARAFFYIEDDKLFKIDLLNNKTEIATPTTFTEGYISELGLYELTVILDNVLYSYDVTTDDWDNIIPLSTELQGKDFKFMTNIVEGTFIACTDGTIFKFDKGLSDFVKFNSTFTDVHSVFVNNQNIFYTETSSSKVYAFK